MKNFLTIAIPALFLSAGIYQTGFSQGYDITVKIKNFPDTAAYLGYNFGDQKFIKDTARVKDSNILEFKDPEESLTRGVYFIYSPNVYFDFIVNEQKFSLETDTSDLVGHMKITGSPENRIFNEYQKYSISRQAEVSRLRSEVDSLVKIKDTLALGEVKNKLTAVSREMLDHQKEIVDDHPGMFVAKLIAAMQRPEIPARPPDYMMTARNSNWQFNYYKKHYFDHFDIADSGLLRTPVFQSRIDEYIDNLTMQHPDSIEEAADFLLGKAAANKETFRYLLVKLTNKYETSHIMGMEKVFVYLAEKYYLTGKAYWADSTLVNKFALRVRALKPNLVGNSAPQMHLVDTLMRPVSLSSVKSRFILLYFYDHNCGHCRESTPQLYDLYNKKLKQLGVTVWAADVMNDLNRGENADESIRKWKEFIRTYGMKDWINIADPYYHDNFRANYNIEATPTIYILNSKYEIIAKRLGVDQLEDFIRKMIGIEDADKS